MYREYIGIQFPYSLFTTSKGRWLLKSFGWQVASILIIIHHHPYIDYQQNFIR